MKIRQILGALAMTGMIVMGTGRARAGSYFFSTGDVDGKMGMASRPDAGGKTEIEAADDFVTTAATQITSATFTGLIPRGVALSDIGQVVVEIYRVFPKDSTFPPSGNVPTRVNSPSDVAFDSRDSAAATLSFSTSILNGNFTVANSVLNGINKIPNQRTNGEGAVNNGQEVQFTVTFGTAFTLPADHYFFVPQVELAGAADNFYWLSAPKPIVAPGTPFPGGSSDLQAWIRNEALDPDWLRVGSDIVGGDPAPQFNGAFTLNGDVLVPLPGAVWGGLALLAAMGGAKLIQGRRVARA